MNKLYDIPIYEFHAIAHMQTIQDYIKNSLETAYPEHQNPLINRTGNYNVNDILRKSKEDYQTRNYHNINPNRVILHEEINRDMQVF